MCNGCPSESDDIDVAMVIVVILIVFAAGLSVTYILI